MTEPAGRPDAPRSIVYLIDDDESVRAAIEDLLTSVGLRARSFCSTQQFIEEGPTDDPGCLVLDVRMPGQSGLDFQRQMKNLGIRLPVIFITGHGNIAMTVRAMKEGAIDFLAKPFDEQALLDAIQQGIEQDRARRDKEARLAAAARTKLWHAQHRGARGDGFGRAGSSEQADRRATRHSARSP